MGRFRALLVGRLLALLLAPVACLTGCGDGEPDRPMIAAAASLRRVLPALIEVYGQCEFAVSYAGSGTLRQQIEAGAGIDLGLFAGDGHVDLLVERGLVVPESRVTIATNEIVLVASEKRPYTFEALPSLPQDALIAIGNPDSVPAGRYAKMALEALGSWEALRSRFVYTQDVAGVLAFVRHGDVTVGILYATEARGMESIRVLDRAQGDWAPRPVVVGIAVKDAARPDEARAFLVFLASPKAREVFERFGFGSP